MLWGLVNLTKGVHSLGDHELIPMDRIRLWWYSRPSYWWLRHQQSRVVFRVRRRAFGTLRGLESTGEKVRIALSLVRASSANVALALLFVALCEVLATVGRPHGILPNLLGEADREIYLGLAYTIAGVGGALLAIYFAAMTVVLSGAYIDATSDVRRLLVLDRAGILYTTLVTVMVVASLAVVGMDLLGRKPAVATVLAVALVVVLASASLLAVGARAFGLLDPVNLGSALRLDLARWTRQAGSRGFGNSDIAFQDHYQRRANAALGTLSSLADVVIRRSDRDIESLGQMGSHLVGAWLDYAGSKSAIAIDSRWFRRRYQHPEWRGEVFGIGVALRTGTQLMPEEVPDEHWVETEIAAPIGRVCASIAKKRDVETTGQFLAMVNLALEALGQRLQVDEAILLWSSTSRAFWSEAGTAVASSSGDQWASVTTELLSIAPIAIVVGIAQHIGDFDGDYVTERVDALLKQGTRLGRGPAALDRKLDWLRAGVEFELAVEGRCITPSWWLIEDASRSLAEFCSGLLPRIADEFELKAKESRAAIGGSAKLQAIMCFRALELYAKLSDNANKVDSVCTSLLAARRRMGVSWPESGVDELRRRVSLQRSATIRALAEVAPQLVADADSVGVEPDLFGHARTVLVDEAFRATLRSDAEAVRAILSSTFQVCILSYDMFYKRVDAERESSYLHAQLLAATDPLVDLLELSGYALLASELGHPQVWNAFEALWSDIVEKNPKVIDCAMRAMALRESGIGVMRLEVLRTGREMEFWREMLGDEANKSRSRPWTGRDAHESALVEAVLRPRGLHKPIVAFAYKFLLPRYGSGEVMPNSVVDFKNALEREVKRRERK